MRFLYGYIPHHDLSILFAFSGIKCGVQYWQMFIVRFFCNAVVSLVVGVIKKCEFLFLPLVQLVYF